MIQKHYNVSLLDAHHLLHVYKMLNVGWNENENENEKKNEIKREVLDFNKDFYQNEERRKRSE